MLDLTQPTTIRPITSTNSTTSHPTIQLKLTDQVLAQLNNIVASSSSHGNQPSQIKLNLNTNSPSLIINNIPYPLTLTPEPAHSQLVKLAHSSSPNLNSSTKRRATELVTISNVSHKATVKPGANKGAIERIGLSLREKGELAEKEREGRRTVLLDTTPSHSRSSSLSRQPAGPTPNTSPALPSSSTLGRAESPAPTSRQPSRLTAVPSKLPRTLHSAASTTSQPQPQPQPQAAAAGEESASEDEDAEGQEDEEDDEDGDFDEVITTAMGSAATKAPVTSTAVGGTGTATGTGVSPGTSVSTPPSPAAVNLPVTTLGLVDATRKSATGAKHSPVVHPQTLHASHAKQVPTYASSGSSSDSSSASSSDSSSSAGPPLSTSTSKPSLATSLGPSPGATATVTARGGVMKGKETLKKESKKASAAAAAAEKEKERDKGSKGSAPSPAVKSRPLNQLHQLQPRLQHHHPQNRSHHPSNLNPLFQNQSPPSHPSRNGSPRQTCETISSRLVSVDRARDRILILLPGEDILQVQLEVALVARRGENCWEITSRMRWEGRGRGARVRVGHPRRGSGQDPALC
ncbi:hypothetical protein T439DRAFT_7186 [Meredithblackwellia eburnea MCA 4105]